jgi:hypothetical protein
MACRRDRSATWPGATTGPAAAPGSDPAMLPADVLTADWLGAVLKAAGPK